VKNVGLFVANRAGSLHTILSFLAGRSESAVMNSVNFIQLLNPLIFSLYIFLLVLTFSASSLMHQSTKPCKSSAINSIKIHFLPSSPKPLWNRETFVWEPHMSGGLWCLYHRSLSGSGSWLGSGSATCVVHLWPVLMAHSSYRMSSHLNSLRPTYHIVHHGSRVRHCESLLGRSRHQKGDDNAQQSLQKTHPQLPMFQLKFHSSVTCQRGLIQSHRKRASTICTERQEVCNEIGSLRRDLQNNDYSWGFFDAIINKGSGVICILRQVELGLSSRGRWDWLNR
jgi:hypothetical protein